jgi:hypothetical protein
VLRTMHSMGIIAATHQSVHKHRARNTTLVSSCMCERIVCCCHSPSSLIHALQGPASGSSSSNGNTRLVLQRKGVPRSSHEQQQDPRQLLMEAASA